MGTITNGRSTLKSAMATACAMVAATVDVGSSGVAKNLSCHGVEF